MFVFTLAIRAIVFADMPMMAVMIVRIMLVMTGMMRVRPVGMGARDHRFWTDQDTVAVQGQSKTSLALEKDFARLWCHGMNGCLEMPASQGIGLVHIADINKDPVAQIKMLLHKAKNR